jgi:hypothetical protein
LLNAKSDAGGRRRYGYFVVKRSEGFRTVQRYDPLGMKLLDYGLNEIDAFVPRHRRIDAEDGDLSGMVDMLMPPRSMMAALACGFLRRISREARSYADNRVMGRGVLSDNDYLVNELNVKADMTDSFPAAQALKTVATERMVSSAHHYQQLVGGEGYRVDSPTNIAGKAFLDTRVFTIFDGTNDLLSQQLTQFCLKRRGDRSMSDFLATAFPYTGPGIVQHGLDMRFLDGELSQEQLVLGGRAIAYAFAITQLTRWARKLGGDTVDRAREAIEFLKCDIDGVAREFALLATGVLDGGEGSAPERLAA